jgi:predicted alpha/beta superfamily hydrolase
MKQTDYKVTYAILISSFIILTAIPGTLISQVSTQDIKLGEKVVIKSAVLDEDRTILIGFPKDYPTSEEKYPVLYILDGEFFFQPAIGAVNFLSECSYIINNPLPQMIIVGIVNVDRNRDYTPTYAPNQLGRLYYPTSGKADIFTEFLSAELIPYIDSEYRTQPYRILAGWSFGGLFTIHTFFEDPELFSAYLAISPSLWWDQDMYVAKTDSILSNRQLLTRKLTVTIGALEGGDIGRAVRDGFIPLMKDRLGTDYPFSVVEIPDEGHSFVPYKAIYEGLASLYSDWRMPFEVINEGFEAVEIFHKNLSGKYGYEINISEWAYMNLINSLLSDKNYTEAKNVLNKYMSDHPNSSWAQFYLGRIYERMNDFKSAKTYYQKAIDVEKSKREPDSERIVTFTITLDGFEKESNPQR